MNIDVELLSDADYYELLHKELTDWVTPLGWRVWMHRDRPWSLSVQTAGWTYAITAYRYRMPCIEPENTSKSLQKLKDILEEILTKNRPVVN